MGSLFTEGSNIPNLRVCQFMGNICVQVAPSNGSTWLLKGNTQGNNDDHKEIWCRLWADYFMFMEKVCNYDIH